MMEFLVTIYFANILIILFPGLNDYGFIVGAAILSMLTASK
jgi:hypothetical protein